MLKLYFTIAQNGSNATVGYTYDTCYITILGSRTVPDTGSSVVTRVNDADIKSKAITPFFSRQALARTQFIIKAEELHMAGIKTQHAHYKRLSSTLPKRIQHSLSTIST